MSRKREMSESKSKLIGSLIEMYDIETAEDIQEALKDLLGGTKVYGVYENTSKFEIYTIPMV